MRPGAWFGLTQPPDELGSLLLTIVRRIDLIGAAGRGPGYLTPMVERAFACLPVHTTSAQTKRRDGNRSESARNRA